jgi:hypothetical protein
MGTKHHQAEGEGSLGLKSGEGHCPFFPYQAGSGCFRQNFLREELGEGADRLEEGGVECERRSPPTPFNA